MAPERTEAAEQGGEVEQLLGFLDYHRATLAWKTAGLDDEQLRRTVGSSSMTLGGMLKHMAFNEDWWFGEILRGTPREERWVRDDPGDDPDWDWHSAARDSADELLGMWQASVDRARERMRGVDPAALAVRPYHHGEVYNARWVVLHMIEEYARHNGHADLVRESIDGETGE